MEVINNAVESIRLNTGLSYPENSLLEIARELGAEVVSAELPDFNGKKVKGYIKWFSSQEEREENAPFVAKIYINANQSDTTQTFTIGHELGHFLLHKNHNNFRIDLEDYSTTNDPENQETEANFFAGSLLLPKNKLVLALREAKNLQEVADLFGVSVPAVESRMKWLRLI